MQFPQNHPLPHSAIIGTPGFVYDFPTAIGLGAPAILHTGFHTVLLRFSSVTNIFSLRISRFFLHDFTSTTKWKPLAVGRHRKLMTYFCQKSPFFLTLRSHGLGQRKIRGPSPPPLFYTKLAFEGRIRWSSLRISSSFPSETQALATSFLYA